MAEVINQVLLASHVGRAESLQVDFGQEIVTVNVPGGKRRGEVKLALFAV